LEPDTFSLVDGHRFVLEAPPSILDLFRQPLRLRDWADGHIGMHTRNNRRSLAALEGSHLALHFDRRRTAPEDFPVISARQAASTEWQPYLKEGGEKDFYFPIFEFLDWTPAARRTYVIPRGRLFGQPGFCVSGISRRLSARVMEKGCYWDTNKVMGFFPKDPAMSMFLIGMLNSDLLTYIAKRMLNESTSIQLNDLWRLPIPKIEQAATEGIGRLAAGCVDALREDISADITPLRRKLNETVYGSLGISAADRERVGAFLNGRGVRTF
jgi:hypothetical protein